MATTTISAESPAERLIAKTRSGIIRIQTTACDEEAIGTGFLLSPTLVATVEHVIDGAVKITLVRNGKVLAHGTVIGEDPTRDLALVRTSKPITGYHFMFAGTAPQLGEDVLALGFPLGLPLTVTKGSVSGLGRTIPINNVRRRQLVQTDAAVNPGNSGGPLLATDTGEVVGLVDLGTTQANGISFAVSAAVAGPLLDAWKVAPQPVTFAYCGDLGNGGGSSAPTSTGGNSLPGYVRSVARVLENSAAVRKLLVTAIGDANTNPTAARQAVELVVAARRDELASAAAAAAPSGATAAQAAFVRAFRLSLASDLLYQQWLDNGSATILSQAQSNDVVTVAAKARFLSLYNQVRTSAGFAPVPTDFPF